MKTISALVFVCLIAVVTAYRVAAEKPNTQRVTYSEASKAKIRAAADQMIEALCPGNDVEADIMNTICMKALNAKMRRKSGNSANYTNCLPCGVADPICWEACPNF